MVKPISQWSPRSKVLLGIASGYAIGAAVMYLAHRGREAGSVVLRLGSFVLLRS